METKKLPLSQVFEDRNNPRIISDAKFQKLIDSILAFPKMLSLRPVVIDGEHNSLGGNMRLRSLNSISQMTYDAIKMEFHKIKLPPRGKGCAVCSDEPTITELIDYEEPACELKQAKGKG